MGQAILNAIEYLLDARRLVRFGDERLGRLLLGDLFCARRDRRCAVGRLAR
jgi:hypothetical protein